MGKGAVKAVAERDAVAWRSVAVPTEHGSWGLALEPIALGLLVAPTAAGLALAIAALAGFMAHRPLRIVWADRQRGQPHPRTALAARFAILYGAIVLSGLAVATWLTGPGCIVPLVVASPLIAAFLVYAARNETRSWQAELAAPTGFAAVAASIAIAGGWPLGEASVLWAAMAARSVPSVLYVRARLRLARGEDARKGLAIAAHVVALAAVLYLVNTGLLPELAGTPYVILLARAAVGLSPHRCALSTRAVGTMEIVLGAMTVLLVAAGFWLA